MKTWFALTCPVCGFRYPLKKLKDAQPIIYPLQLVTGGGRAKGFTVLDYLPWTKLPDMKQTEAWNSILCLYNRLSAAYDNFYAFLGFLSPKMKTLLQELNKSYASPYIMEPFADYTPSYIQANPLAEPYSTPDYSEAYRALLIQPTMRGERL